MDVLQEIAASLRNGEDERVAELTRQAMDAGLPVGEILDNGLIGGMNVVGDLFRRHEIFLPEVLLAARAMQRGIDLITPLMIEEGIPTAGKVVIGTAHGDLHDIGKNLVGIMLEGTGFEVIDLGSDVTPEKFVETAESEGATVVGLSALLTTTMTGMRDVVELVRSRGLQDTVKVIVGGAPLSRRFADDIGADAYGFDAANAVERIRELTGG